MSIFQKSYQQFLNIFFLEGPVLVASPCIMYFYVQICKIFLQFSKFPWNKLPIYSLIFPTLGLITDWQHLRSNLVLLQISAFEYLKITMFFFCFCFVLFLFFAKSIQSSDWKVHNLFLQFTLTYYFIYENKWFDPCSNIKGNFFRLFLFLFVCLFVLFLFLVLFCFCFVFCFWLFY